MNNNKKPRVRFAPSPTGFLHIGGLRTALYNYLFVRKNKGDFILRIEDTDIKRKVKGAVENLIKTLKQVGLDYDEGPILRNNKLTEIGEYGPYIQSERLDIYKKYAEELVKKDKAYYCFCTPEDLEKMRREQMSRGTAPMYDERCRRLSKKEVDKRIKAGIPYVVRLKIPEFGSIKFNDLIRGEIEFDYKNIDDQVLLKSDGYPTYHLANVVDDHLMGISHVIRGEEWLPSTPKHIFLYQAFGWDIPEFAHLPLLLNPDKTKLSKRQGDVAVEDYLAKGYLPEALINFVAFLGWNPGDEREIFSLEELIKEFSLERVGKSGAVFNREKLDWLNGHYIRQLDIDELTEKCIPYLEQTKLIKKIPNPKSQIPNKFQIQNSKFKILETEEVVDFNYIKKVVALEQDRLKRLDKIGELTKFFFVDQLEYDPELLIWKKVTKEQTLENLKLAEGIISKIDQKEFKKEILKKVLMKLTKKTGVGELLWPFRVALTGRKASPDPFEISEVLEKKKVLKRIKKAKLLLEK